MPLRKVFITSLVFCCCLFSALASANLLIHPTRVNLTANERSQTLTIGNTSSVPASYELSWAEKVALPGGGYTSLDGKESEAKNIASEYIRFSPRRVTLQPGERQSVKLLVRRARDLDDGELRSHLRFKAVPLQDNKNTSRADAQSMQVNVVLNFAVPVALQIGDYDSAVTIDNAAIRFNPDTGTGQVTAELSRTGKHSAWGDLEAYWTALGQDEVLLAKTAGLNFWSEIATLNTKLSWATTNFQPANGKLRVVYKGIGKFAGTTYHEAVFDISQADMLTPTGS